MLLVEESLVPDAALPVAALKDQLRLGTAFAEVAEGDAYLRELLRAALAAVEGRTAKALVARAFRLTLEDWRRPDAQPLPVAPVIEVAEIRLLNRDGGEAVADPSLWRLVSDAHRPRIAATGAALPSVPAGGRAVVRFTAGFGSDWAAVPVDLRQAVLMLAAQYYEHRQGAGAEPGAMDFGVRALIERWRAVRGFGGGRR
jgi:uncharacterized phiE125 gp8 family phage protein